MSASPRILISGYYGYANAGDEAMLGGLAAGFREVAPEAELVVLSGDPESTIREHGLMAVPRDLRSAWHHARTSDLLISGGGGLLQDATSWASPFYYLAVIRVARRARKPVAFIGQSIGPLSRSWIRWAVRRELAGVRVIAVRDVQSRQALLGLGLAREVEVTADLAFLLPPPTPEIVAMVRQKVGLEGDDEPVLGVALRPRVGYGADEELAERLGAEIGVAAEQLGLRPVFLPMQPSQDSAFARTAASTVSRGAPLVAPGLTAAELHGLVTSCDLLVGMRLHSLVFATLGAVPYVGISYDPKVDGLLETLGLTPATSVQQLDLKALAREIKRTWEDRDARKGELARKRESLRAAARRNVELALSVLS
ncbi:MAG: polysaccharide pyruvyl transferase CsaB [Armatimonadetes bacterium]|nr:polysaccharide pyruvyl transferase CsaB [Armatimonadota bacterium]